MCATSSLISPSKSLKEIIQNTPLFSKYSKILNMADPRFFDIYNYEINSFSICQAHRCLGTELSVYSESKVNRKCKLVKITKVRGSPILHFNINEKIYFYGIRGIKANYKINLKWVGCGTHSYISPSEYFKQIIQETSKEQKMNLHNF
jgi:hypothetical protein